MCELLGMVSNVTADLAFSFTGLALRGGQTGPHADGWGVSLYEGPFARTFLEPHPAFSSPLARFVRENPMKSRLSIAHVRKMTRGVASIENTHPFLRVYDGRHVVFAHNGTLPSVKSRRLEHESAIGETDSEYAFCVMLEALRRRHGPKYPDDPVALGAELYELANDLGSDGVFNFLWADGQNLFARCGDHLSAIVRRTPFGRATLVDADLSVRLEEEIDSSAPDARVAVVATFPLTRDEAWEAATPGTLWVFGGGDLLATFK
ncbi:MAG TPA: class II glutamine amidotransferase [Polyangiaceae bacterium]|nr:class II glutamine amidotransferase [Polyangiaceae bacterium]